MAMAMSLAEKRRNFAGDWKCSICHELPFSPFQTLCGHCMCLECANMLPVSGAGKRKCPTCSVYFSEILKQPQLARTLEDLASMLWPDAWAFWEALRAIDVNKDVAIFNLVSRFVANADEDTLAAVRLLRFSARYGHEENKYRFLFLEPLLIAEAGNKWDGFGPWLERVMDKSESDDSFLYVSIAEAAESAHAAAAPRLIPLLSRITLESGWASALILRDFSVFAQKYIGCVEGGWATLVDAVGFTTIAPTREIASLFAEAPTARHLTLLTAGLKAQFDVNDDDSEADSDENLPGIETLDAVVGTVASALARLEPALRAELDILIVHFVSTLCTLLPSAQAAELLRRHSFNVGFGAARSSGSGLKNSVASDESASGPAAAASRKRGREA